MGVQEKSDVVGSGSELTVDDGWSTINTGFGLDVGGEDAAVG